MAAAGLGSSNRQRRITTSHPVSHPDDTHPREMGSSGVDDIEAQQQKQQHSPADTNDFMCACRRTTSWSDVTLNSAAPSPSVARQRWQVEEDALHGYPSLAARVGNTESYAVYRRFSALNARNLLYHQARLVHLEHALDDLEKKYAHHERLHCIVGELFGDHSAGTPGYELCRKHEQVSKALDKYNHLLLDQAKLHRLLKPDKTIVDSLWNIIRSEKTKNPDWLQYPESAVYAVDDATREPIQADLVTLNPAFRQQDPFTKFFTGHVLSWWHFVYSLFRKPDNDRDEYIYGDRVVSRYMRACVMVVAASLPTLSIVALSFIDSMGWRLGFIVLFSGVFASALSFFTEARSVEVFTASVALASVQVVFVGTAFGNGNGNGSGSGNGIGNGNGLGVT